MSYIPQAYTPHSLQKLFNHPKNGYLLLDRKLKVIEANNTIVELVKIAPQDLKELPFGNALRCVHTGDHFDGCGYGSICDDCFLHKALKLARRRKTSVLKKTGKLPMGINDTLHRACLHINVHPVQYQGQLHLLLEIVDISTQDGCQP